MTYLKRSYRVFPLSSDLLPDTLTLNFKTWKVYGGLLLHSDVGTGLFCPMTPIWKRLQCSAPSLLHRQGLTYYFQIVPDLPNC